LIGSHGLGLADTSSIKLLSNVGLGFLFLLAGYELIRSYCASRPAKLAIAGWVLSAIIAVVAVAGLGSVGLRARLCAYRASLDDDRPGHLAAHPS
jgi:Kef-type K+ transport system membrane component KefB